MAKTDLKVARLLDANLNRAREGIRVIEDTARFLWNDRLLYESLRKARHMLHQVTARHYPTLISQRESTLDVGRKIKESSRPSQQAGFSANLRRAQEATRVLEEYSKFFSPQAGIAFKKIRYKLYAIEKKVWSKIT